MSDFQSGKPLLPCYFKHYRPGPWMSLPIVVYSRRTAGSNTRESSYLKCYFRFVLLFYAIDSAGISSNCHSSIPACKCACKLCLNKPQPVSDTDAACAEKECCSDRCKVHNLRCDPDSSKVWKNDYFHPESYGERN